LPEERPDLDLEHRRALAVAAESLTLDEPLGRAILETCG
jgi:hypothetical protein